MASLISVIVPVYNVEPYLRRCLDSIIGQTYPHLEIICVNDGSPDNSLAILEEYAAKDSRIIVISKENGGISSARNAGMDVATGEFLSFVDSDDSLELDCYERCMEVFEEDVDVISFPYSRIKLDGTSFTYKQQLHGKRTFFEGMIFLQRWSVCNKVFRSKKIQDNNIRFIEGKIYEDLDLCVRFFLVYKPTVYYIERALYKYYERASSIVWETFKKAQGKSVQNIYLLDNIYEFLNKNKSLESNKNDFLRVCEYCFRHASSNAPDVEQALCYAEMTKRLIQWNFAYDDYPMLNELSRGRYEIRFLKDVNPVKLNGMERFFSVKKELGLKVIRLFGKRIFTWKR